MTRFQAIDMSQLPTPDVVETLDFEVIRAALLADLAARWPEFDMSAIEADPAVKVLEVAAYRELILRARINDAARAVLLPTAMAADLDNLAANYHVTRAVVTPATETEPAVMESDERLRERVHLAIEAYATVGTLGAYRFHALDADPLVKDVGVFKPAEGTGEVTVAVLSSIGDGTADAEMIANVRGRLMDDAVRPLTDVIDVRGALITPYTVAVTLKIAIGPDPEVIRTQVVSALAEYAADRHRVGRTVYRDGLIAAAHVAGVETVILDSPADDITPGPDGAAWASAINVTTEVID